MKGILEPSHELAHFADEEAETPKLKCCKAQGCLCGSSAWGGSAREGKSQEGALWDQAWKGNYG